MKTTIENSSYKSDLTNKDKIIKQPVFLPLTK